MAQTEWTDNEALPTAIALPADSSLPTERADAPSTGEERPRWQEPYVSRFVTLADDEDRTAWLHFCHGHHVEFLYWQVTAAACRAALAALAAGDAPALAHRMGRIARLIRGSGALLAYCGQFDPGVYDPCLRASMSAERDDFSGDMSRDFLTMMAAKADLVEALEAAGDEGAGPLRAFRDAERVWHRHHGDVVRRLHSGKSLLREKVEALTAQEEDFDFRAYVDSVVHGRQALDDYDDYFGVERRATMTIDDYWTQALGKLATVHHRFAMDAPTRAELMRGDAAVLAILSERLEGEDDHPPEGPPDSPA